MNADGFIVYDSGLMTRFKDFVAGIVLVDRVKVRAVKSESRSQNPETNALDGVGFDQPSIKAWRRIYTELGLNPTKTRNAAEALLRRLRKTGTLPRINTVVDACNAVSIKHGIPVAALNISMMSLPLTVRQASGTESFTDISGNRSVLDVDEVSFFDADGVPHARYWNHKQSAKSAVSKESTRILVTIEAVHDGAEASVRAALADLLEELRVGGLKLESDDYLVWLYQARTLGFTELRL